MLMTAFSHFRLFETVGPEGVHGVVEEPGDTAQAVVLVGIRMLNKLDIRPLQSLHIGHGDDDHLVLFDHLCEQHGVLVVNIGHDHHHHDHCHHCADHMLDQ